MLRREITRKGLERPGPHQGKIQTVHPLFSPPLSGVRRHVISPAYREHLQWTTLSCVIHRVVHKLCTGQGNAVDNSRRFDREAGQTVTYDGRVASTAVLHARRSPTPAGGVYAPVMRPNQR
ncbi:hypothetical protein Airi01_065290 [Actinoallomurus iriomotensis]|uniref:Uncharacterized protein n=1 Tax=Actinoallomurus iriomotensis TaxID=478107 RepID=A0A9W6VT80_9ACTN|nr:hypothetical protein Airi01_065290 [Actinoallomurus iriomotensis]